MNTNLKWVMCKLATLFFFFAMVPGAKCWLTKHLLQLTYAIFGWIQRKFWWNIVLYYYLIVKFKFSIPSPFYTYKFKVDLKLINLRMKFPFFSVLRFFSNLIIEILHYNLFHSSSYMLCCLSIFFSTFHFVTTSFLSFQPNGL